MDVGGLELVVLDLVREGRRLGHDAQVVCLDSPGALAGEVEAAGTKLTCFEKPPGLHPDLVVQIRSFLRRERPDIVHTHQIGALFYAGLAARGVRGTTVVHTEHGVHYPGRFRFRFLARLAGLHASRFFCVSQDIAAKVLENRVAPRSKVRFIPNGIDVRRFDAGGDRPQLRRSLGLPPDAPVIGTVGRLAPIKRQDLLIRAFAGLRRRVPGAHLLLVGDGPSMADLRRLADALDLGGCMTFAGYQTRPESYLLAMDLFALTSRSEGMPLAVLEAWAVGIPVVAARVGGLPELIAHDETGLLVEPGDETALEAAFAGLILDPPRSRRIGRAGRDRVLAHFDVRTTASAYDHHYRTLLGRIG
jgi:glycosyltransferase involved in cell wall biosynthesis